uniref:Chemokine (C-X-C motif) receptor 3, tandem duplicate 2 n=1 Tax=Nothobranchius furzeri TaxID=105023 RepID=A0A8C6KK76_NOTFU
MESATPTEDYWTYEESSASVAGVVARPCLQDDVYSFAKMYPPVVYSLIFILAVLGNVLVLCVITRYKISQRGGICAFSLTDTFLLHLAVSDLLLAFTLPLFAVQWTHEWVFGTALCKISGALFSLNRYSGILFLACISFDRYLAIVHAVGSGWKRNTCHAQVACAVIWVVCLGLSGVDIAFKQVSEVGTGEGQKMSLCQTWFVRNPDQWQSLCNASRRQKRKSLRLIISLVSVFVICWAPYNCFRLADSLEKLGVVAGGCQFGRVLDLGTLITESVGLSHCALNPLLYGFVGVRFRKELLKMFTEAPGRRGLLRMNDWKEKKPKKLTSCSSESEITSYSVMV